MNCEQCERERSEMFKWFLALDGGLDGAIY